MTDRVEGTEERVRGRAILAARRITLRYVSSKLEDKAEDAIRQIIEAEIEAAFEAGRSSGEKWVSTSERLPEMREIYEGSPLRSEVVLMFNGHYIQCGQYQETYTRRVARWENASGRVEMVTHWQPLPAPPDSGDKPRGDGRG